MMSTLQKFYEGRVVLVTGGSGFLGRVLLLKLLKSCPNIKGIIVFLRKKHGQSCQERLFQILSSSEFSAVPKESLVKVSPIEADIEKEGLGLSSKDREFLLTSRISVVFHIAASVRLNEPLDVAIKTNTLPVLEVTQLCEEMAQIEALVYVSTAYSQCPNSEIKEEVYPMPVDNGQIFDGKMLDEEIAMKCTYRKNGQWPNTYTLSKALAEEMIQKINGRLSVAIFRPSIVINAWKEPNPGWINNIQTVTRILRGVYLGRTRVGRFSDGKVADLVPVDMCVNAMIATAWETATSNHRGQTKVYNFVSGAQNPITWKEYWSICVQKIIENPTAHAQWYLFYVTIPLWPVYFSLWLCLELIPAFLIQGLHYCTFGPKRSVKDAFASLQYTTIVGYFSVNGWMYQDKNMRSLLAKLTPEDRDIFSFDIKQINWNKYLENCVMGVRIYILKDDLSTVPQARKRYKM
ncbi:hypothetical protein Cfor_05961 [Coptotermes formosanus]|uniref:Fatty acyl-CoA reductase n=1 Tax=Coptotermes formosanus TaxID=36987 RepID=A0A6L2PVX4_COPFO|nr:hypothetical protein Cfor_05961 [Coptotermes formosanus]